MLGGLFLFVAAEAGEAQEPGQQHCQQEDHEHAQQQQDDLLDDQFSPGFLVRFEQKLHRGPANPFEAHPINEMDDDRRGNQGCADHHAERIQKQFKHGS
jgi:hypothetical protein